MIAIGLTNCNSNPKSLRSGSQSRSDWSKHTSDSDRAQNRHMQAKILEEFGD